MAAEVDIGFFAGQHQQVIVREPGTFGVQCFQALEPFLLGNFGRNLAVALGAFRAALAFAVPLTLADWTSQAYVSYCDFPNLGKFPYVRMAMAWILFALLLIAIFWITHHG